MTSAEQITDVFVTHGEGPLWRPDEGLLILDMLAGALVTIDLETGSAVRRVVGEVAAAVRPRAGGGLVIATRNSFVLESINGAVESEHPAFQDPRVRFNEGTSTPDGAFLCGTMAWDEASSAGRVYRFGPDGDISVALDGVTMSNGMFFDVTHQTAYYIDSRTQRIDSFEWDGRRIVDRRPFVEIDASLGMPDGLTVDVDGGVWVALWGGSVVHRYDPDGALTDVVDVPVSQVTSCVFGGPELADLFVTTSRLGKAGGEAGAGAVFLVPTSTRGHLPLAFGG